MKEDDLLLYKKLKELHNNLTSRHLSIFERLEEYFESLSLYEEEDFKDVIALSILASDSLKNFITDIYNSSSLSHAEKYYIAYHLDRIALSIEDIVNVFIGNPIYSYMSSASINRFLIESCINVLYLLKKDSEFEYGRFIVSAVLESKKMDKALAPWKLSTDKSISLSVGSHLSKDDEIDEKTFEEFLDSLDLNYKDIKKDLKKNRIASIQNRCRFISEKWAFLYDMKYRGLSSWGHGDLTRGFICSLVDKDGIDDRRIFESIHQIIWAIETCFEFINEACNILELPKEEQQEYEGLYHFIYRMWGIVVKKGYSQFHVPQGKNIATFSSLDLNVDGYI